MLAFWGVHIAAIAGSRSYIGVVVAGPRARRRRCTHLHVRRHGGLPPVLRPPGVQDLAVFQFVLASARRPRPEGRLWWAAHHRPTTALRQPSDIHSARSAGFWYSHVGWILRPESRDRFSASRTSRSTPSCAGSTRYMTWCPRSRWRIALPVRRVRPASSGASSSHHRPLLARTFTINSLGARVRPRRYATNDTRATTVARAHHHGRGLAQQPPPLQSSANQGFFWWSRPDLLRAADSSPPVGICAGI